MKPIAILVADSHLSKDNIPVVKAIFKQVIEKAIELKVKFILHAGDIFTSRTGQPLSVLIAWQEIILDIKKAGINMMAIPGNHDKTDLESKDSYLDVFDCDHFQVIKEACILPTSTLGFDIDIAFIPHFKESGSYSERLLELKKIINKETILITHIAVNGVRNNDGSTVENQLDESSFKQFHSVFVGHYHNQSQVGKNIYYVGSTHPENFGEDNEKGCTIIYNDGSHEFCKLKFKEYEKIEINIDKLTPAAIKEIVKSTRTDQDHVRIVLTGDQSKLQAFDKSILTDKGFDVKFKSDEVKIGLESAEREEFVSFDINGIFEEFEVFVEKNQIQNKELGLSYLKKL